MNANEIKTNEDGTRNCTRCHGVGSIDGKACPRCNGACTFAPVDIVAIVDTICRTGKCRKIRASFPSGLNKFSTVAGSRAFYVWRLARFHGGVDVSMPVAAGIAIGGDPFKAELDELVKTVAKECFGSDMRAAKRWALVSTITA